MWQTLAYSLTFTRLSFRKHRLLLVLDLGIAMRIEAVAFVKYRRRYRLK